MLLVVGFGSAISRIGDKTQVEFDAVNITEMDLNESYARENGTYKSECSNGKCAYVLEISPYDKRDGNYSIIPTSRKVKVKMSNYEVVRDDPYLRDDKGNLLTPAQRLIVAREMLEADLVKQEAILAEGYRIDMRRMQTREEAFSDITNGLDLER